MDFRSAADELEAGKLSHQEVIEQILQLPCLYGFVPPSEDRLFCIQVYDKLLHCNLNVALVYSHFEMAMWALDKFDIPSDWFVSQWTEVREGLEACEECGIEGVAFDADPEGGELRGLVIDSRSLSELLEV